MNKRQLIKSLKNEGFSSSIIRAFEKVPREKFISKDFEEQAYEDIALPLKEGATISQPYTIAFMLDLLELQRIIDNSGNHYINSQNSLMDNSEKRILINKIIHDKIKSPIAVNPLIKKSFGTFGCSRCKYKQDKHLDIRQFALRATKSSKLSINRIKKMKIIEIGSGCGYMLALLYEITKGNIFGIELSKELVLMSKNILKELKYNKIKIICKNGYFGLKEKAPFDRILISASSDKIPEHLFEQLKDGGIIVVPVRNSIFKIKKIKNKYEVKEFPGFAFVPLKKTP